MGKEFTIRIPRLKPFIDFCAMNESVYFFKKPGVATVMDDHGGFVSAVCRLMRESLSVSLLKERLIERFPVEVNHLNDLLSTLDQEYLLEDVACNDRGLLSEYDAIRWSRNAEFFGAYNKSSINKFTYQQKLKNIKVTILGLGGVGSQVLYNLVAMGVHNLKIVDYDRVELSNLNRQIIYCESDVGRYKTEAAKEKILSLLPAANVEVINHKIKSSAEIKSMIDGQDFVISAIDYPRESILDWVNQACVSADVPFICGALDSSSAVYYTIIPGKTGCIECWKSSARKSNLVFQDVMKNDGFVKAQSPNVTMMPFISILSGMIANELLKIVTDIAKPQSLARMCAYDFTSGLIGHPESWEIDLDCVICQANCRV